MTIDTTPRHAGRPPAGDAEALAPRPATERPYNRPMDFRAYDPEKDKDTAHRIWREAGWLDEGKEEAMDLFVTAGRALVAELNGAAECLVLSVPGSVRHLQADLPLSAVTGVTTSRIARKQHLASRLTAALVAEDVAAGAVVSALGMFEQGYYDRLGFGTGGYEHRVRFDPARLRVDLDVRAPRRLTKDDWAAVHASRLVRRRGHGSCNLTPPEVTHADMLWAEKEAFGLGYFDGPEDTLSHHVWFSVKENVEQGPYTVRWMAWQTPAQFRELLALIKSLADQVAIVSLREPPGIQWQDLLSKPFQSQTLSRRGELEQGIQAHAYWQMRICDLAACMRRTCLAVTEPLRFNLELADPIADFLPDEAPWRGVAGAYVVTLGETSSAQPGHETKLPTLAAPVSTFTRLWMGVRSATGLAATDDLAGPAELLADLDRVLRLPDPKPDWDF